MITTFPFETDNVKVYDISHERTLITSRVQVPRDSQVPPYDGQIYP